jgi:hypothetical protein
MTLVRTERRGARRYPGGAAGLGIVKLRTGPELTVVDLSATGARVRGEARLLPGASIVMQSGIGGDSRTLRARVVRCHVSALTGVHVEYEGGVMFTHGVTFRVREGTGHAG